MATSKTHNTPSGIPKRHSMSSPASTSNTTFRSLRSLLPFGPSKPASSIPDQSATGSKSPFSGFRKSVSHERKASQPTLPPPALAIQTPRRSVSLQEQLRERPLPVLPASKRSTGPDEMDYLPPPSPGSPFQADLSTIIEADTSGISRHIPTSSQSPSPSPSPHNLRAPDMFSDSHSDTDRSFIDFSPTRLTPDDMDAMIAKDYATARGWAADPNNSNPQEDDSLDETDALDPTLRTLLSPNNLVTSNLRSTAGMRPVDPPTPTPSFKVDKVDVVHYHATSNHDVVPLTPSQRNVPRLPSTLPRPRPTVNRVASGASLASLPGDDDTFHAKHNRPPPSPLSSTSRGINARPSSYTSSTLDHTVRKSPRESKFNTRSFSISGNVFTPPPDVERIQLPNSLSRASSLRPHSLLPAARIATSLDIPRSTPRRSFDFTPSEFGLRANTSASVSTPSLPGSASRNRKRSMSVEEQRSPLSSRPSHYTLPGRYSITPNSRSRDGYSESERPGSSLSSVRSQGQAGSKTEWLGPRTVKAFKAAGLLDFERAGSSSPSDASKLGSLYDQSRSRTASSRGPSRMGVSEGGHERWESVSNVGSFHLQRFSPADSPTMTYSSVSRDRDTPRSSSTAPTSVSTTSWRDQDEIRDLKERHTMEMGALLGALSDSQRTAKVLREENTDLRERLTSFERDVESLKANYNRLLGCEQENDLLRNMVGDLKRELDEIKHPSTSAPVRFGSLGRSYTNGPYIPSRLGLETFADAVAAQSIGPEDIPTTSTPAPCRTSVRGAVSPELPHRRLSSSSSVFPLLPSNMTMLLGSDSSDMEDDALVTHLDIAAPIPIPIGRGHHTHDTSIASITSISPTTGNFSMMTGSPKSLFLHPEHELHLKDMDSLELSYRQSSPDSSMSRQQ